MVVAGGVECPPDAELTGLSDVAGDGACEVGEIVIVGLVAREPVSLIEHDRAVNRGKDVAGIPMEEFLDIKLDSRVRGQSFRVLPLAIFI